MNCLACITVCAVEQKCKFDPDRASRTHHPHHCQLHLHSFPDILRESYQYESIRSRNHAPGRHGFRLTPSALKRRPARGGADLLASVSLAGPKLRPDYLVTDPGSLRIAGFTVFGSRSRDIQAFSLVPTSSSDMWRVSRRTSLPNSKGCERHAVAIAGSLAGDLRCPPTHELIGGRRFAW